MWLELHLFFFSHLLDKKLKSHFEKFSNPQLCSQSLSITIFFLQNIFGFGIRIELFIFTVNTVAQIQKLLCLLST